jgi:hypothetical protein
MPPPFRLDDVFCGVRGELARYPGDVWILPHASVCIFETGLYMMHAPPSLNYEERLRSDEWSWQGIVERMQDPAYNMKVWLETSNDDDDDFNTDAAATPSPVNVTIEILFTRGGARGDGLFPEHWLDAHEPPGTLFDISPPPEPLFRGRPLQDTAQCFRFSFDCGPQQVTAHRTGNWHILRLALSDHSQHWRRIQHVLRAALARRRLSRTRRALALAMALHPRLGATTPMRVLPPDVLSALTQRCC